MNIIKTDPVSMKTLLMEYVKKYRNQHVKVGMDFFCSIASLSKVKKLDTLVPCESPIHKVYSGSRLGNGEGNCRRN